MMKMMWLPLMVILIPVALLADAGVLIPSTVSDYPDPEVLSLYRMEINITITDKIAETKVLQVYRNHKDMTLEGQYIFTIPEMAMIKDFAIWEEGVRIPGIIMEKERARKIYEQLVWQAIDPGLLERAGLEHEINYFSVNVAPIWPQGTKRIEMFYTEDLPMNQRTVFYDFPFEPTLYEHEEAESLSITLRIESRIAIEDFSVSSESFGLEIVNQSDSMIEARYAGRNVSFVEDLSISFKERFDDVSMEVLAYRDVEERGEYFYLDGIPSPQTGFFMVKAGFHIKEDAENKGSGRNYLFLFDNSLSMMWKQIETGYAALNSLLELVDEKSTVNVACFSLSVDRKWKDAPANTAATRNEALLFLRSKYIEGGTNIEKLLTELRRERDIIPIIITDGYPTHGEINYQRLFSLAEGLPSLFIVGIGDNPNRVLLEKLASATGGRYLWLRSMNKEKLQLFFETIGGGEISDIRLRLSPSKVFTDVYPDIGQATFNGNDVSFTGKYIKPVTNATVELSFVHMGKKRKLTENFTFPESEKKYKEVGRLWAKKRVDFLLEKIRIEGEKDEWVKEIIALSKQFKFVTPYTSFLAAPRALLRPRIIRPGDPMLIVKADTSIIDIVVLFPFGLTKRMVYHAEEDQWRVRFLVPSSTPDGKYSAVLVMKDRHGNIYREKKSYIIDREPPIIRMELAKNVFLAGEEVFVKAYASRDTKKIEASIDGCVPFLLVYDQSYLASVGTMRIPHNLSTGRYLLKIVAEDFAFNTTYKEIELDIVGN
jgi:Ca-activated chloride channel family protein